MSFGCTRWAVWWATWAAWVATQPTMPPIEKMHQHWWLSQTTMSPMLDDGQQIPDPQQDTPDFRAEEPLWVAYKLHMRERNRPYRLSPHRKKAGALPSWDYADNMGCTCCTVYKRLTPLATCAVITTRHFLTTASSVELVLRGHRGQRSLENILGVWYDHNIYAQNSSFYMSIARVHYHPEFQRPENVNRSHPLPVTFDLAVLASTYNVYGWYLWRSNTRICPRASSSWTQQASPSPIRGHPRREIQYCVGYQFMWSYNRVPTPFHKYFVRTEEYGPCAKKEWGWFICIEGHQWAKHGMDSGSTLFRTHDGYDRRYDGLVGMLTVSMRLREPTINLYYTVLDCHFVLDFLYLAYMGRLPYEFLDYRFEDTQWAAPRPHAWAWIRHDYTLGEQHEYEMPWW
ncbi:uncharacterized protein LOC123707257 isoform X2 [Pieris brassicae]|uniref:uncharacterized protein LOC123707257 isoform X2 n=1 Tax=Pieris brassicae TaxID=7116 RepID=UPI001E661F08|nr:uncharacterized protein LOC123707257 isoform X2 [Pieris brassicae]